MISTFQKILFVAFMTGFVLPVHAQQSLYSDIKAHRPGDLITVILVENISGSFNSDANTASNTSGRAESGVQGNFLPFEPVFGADAQVEYNSDERVSANQGQLLEGTLSVRVEEISNSGNLMVMGSRSTEINGERHEMTIEGLVRPSDVTDANEVLSYRIANAQITYLKKEGAKEKFHKTGFGRKVIWGLVGVATGAAVIIFK